MNIKLKELMDIMTCKDENELFIKVSEILEKMGVAVMYPNGGVKDLYALCCDVAKILNKDIK